MILKSSFEKFSLPDADGDYFLRPDRILGAFIIDPNILMLNGSKTEHHVLLQPALLEDRIVGKRMLHASLAHLKNVERLGMFFEFAEADVLGEHAASGDNDEQVEMMQTPTPRSMKISPLIIASGTGTANALNESSSQSL
jgi:hypothetical protein